MMIQTISQIFLWLAFLYVLANILLLTPPAIKGLVIGNKLKNELEKEGIINGYTEYFKYLDQSFSNLGFTLNSELFHNQYDTTKIRAIKNEKINNFRKFRKMMIKNFFLIVALMLLFVIDLNFI